ncbi:MAG: 4-(cytidine 5'-diphospho)-2-C-methyl-D-erythritol kinase, partial [Flavobacteriales bacterium]
MIVFPNCKINIGLFVTSKRPDGFHNIESVFMPVAWNDVLEINHAQGVSGSFTQSGLTIDADIEQNIVVKAARLMQREFAIGEMDIHLMKNLPMGAGLGGGSADGAFAISAINAIFDLNLSKIQMAQLAAQLGSDCPFFIYNSPCFVSGRGEIIEPIHLDLSSYYIGLIHPGIHLSTPLAYSKIKPEEATFDLRLLNQTPIEEWEEMVENDFELPVFSMFPLIGDIKSAMYESGALYASMSGSGSAVYGIFSEMPNLDEIKKDLRLTSALAYTG